MDWLHLQGIGFIQLMQETFKENSELMLFLSHLGDPRNAFLIYFPLAYFCHKPTGVKVLWASSISEWLNALFKWVLFGHRPYWWVNFSSLYDDGNRPNVTQYRLTCETGPGSPSGHAMVTACVWFLMIYSFVANKPRKSFNRSVVAAALWLGFTMFMVLVSLSRCYIATHFPHQVVAGTLVGCLLGYLLVAMPTGHMSLRVYAAASLLIELTAPALYWFVAVLGYDPLWSLSLATTWCAKREWVHLDTTLFFAITRDASALLGLGVGLWTTRSATPAIDPPRGDTAPTDAGNELSSADDTFSFQTSAILLSWILTRGLEYVPIPQQNPLIYYAIAFGRYFIMSFSVTVIIPACCRLLLSTGDKLKDR